MHEGKNKSRTEKQRNGENERIEGEWMKKEGGVENKGVDRGDQNKLKGMRRIITRRQRYFNLLMGMKSRCPP